MRFGDDTIESARFSSWAKSMWVWIKIWFDYTLRDDSSPEPYDSLMVDNFLFEDGGVGAEKTFWSESSILSNWSNSNSSFYVPISYASLSTFSYFLPCAC